MGKTALSVRLARRLGGEIVSADSMQIYRGMDIGTAKPTPEERQGIPHHLMDIADPGQAFSVADYVLLAHRTIKDIARRSKLPILVGGTGLYVGAVIDNLRFSPQTGDAALRQRLRGVADARGPEYLHGMLTRVDPALAERLDPRNLGRVIRALEVHILTGKPMSWHILQSRLCPSPYRLCMIGLDCRDRAALYRRIDGRVDDMMEAGLKEEARSLFARASATAAQAIGYKELAEYFTGEADLGQCVEQIKRASRRYAKRQLTWFRRDGRIQWLFVDDYADADALERAALDIIDASELMQNGCAI